MKHLSFTLLLLLGSIFPAFAQQKWELGLTAQMGNFTKPADEEINFPSIRDRNSTSAGTALTYGVYAQCRIFRALAVSGGLSYSLSTYDSQRDIQFRDSFWERDDIWNTTISERNLLLPLTLHWLPSISSRWSFGLGTTLSCHLKTEIVVNYSEHHPPSPSPSPISSLIECGSAFDERFQYASSVQLLLNGSVSYRMGQNTDIGFAVLWSQKPNQGPCQRYFYPDGYYQSKSTQQTLFYSDGRLLLFPKSLAVSLRHNLLNTN